MEYLSSVEKFYYRNGKTSIEVSDFDLETQTITFPIRSYSPFFEVFSEKIQQLLEAGICPHRLAKKTLSTDGKNKKMYKMYDEEIPALVLSMEDLGVGFEICFIPLMLSVAVLFFEVAYSKAKEYLAVPFKVFTFIRTSRV